MPENYEDFEDITEFLDALCGHSCYDESGGSVTENGVFYARFNFPVSKENEAMLRHFGFDDFGKMPLPIGFVFTEDSRGFTDSTAWHSLGALEIEWARIIEELHEASSSGESEESDRYGH